MKRCVFLLSLLLVCLASPARAQSSAPVHNVQWGSGAPENVVAGATGDFYFDTANSIMYLKEDFNGQRTGWHQVLANIAGTAPADATYITKTANGTLSAEQALSALATGVMKVTTSTGAISTAVAGTDYLAGGASSQAGYFGAVIGSGAGIAVSNTTANSCGTTAAALSSGSTNTAGAFTVGATSGTSCTLTFNVTAPTGWVCYGNNETAASRVAAWSRLSTTAGKFTGTFTAADVINYVCAAY